MKRIAGRFTVLIALSVLTACTFPGWPTYTSTAYSFQLQYPPGGSIAPGATDTSIRIQLPISAGTNLAEKYLDIDVHDGAATCESPLASGYAPGVITPVSMTINGLTWVKENASEGAAGSHIDWTAYSTVRGSVCVALTFVLHSHNPGMYATPPPTFNRDAESAVFVEIVNTFQWLSGGPTPPPPPHPDVAPALIASTATLVPTLSPSDTPTSLPPTPTPTNTPTSSPLTFTPRVSPSEFNYKTNLEACRINIPKVDISVAVSSPSLVHSVVLFFLLKNKANGAETPWNEGLAMNPKGNGVFDRTVSANQVPHLPVISTGGASAWFEYQFVATNLHGSTIGRSQVYSDVSLTPCK